MIDDSLGMCGGMWWGSVVAQNLPSERKLPMGNVQKKVKKTNNSAFSATHTYIKLTLVSFFLLFFMHLPLTPGRKCRRNLQVCSERDDQSWVVTSLTSRLFALAVQHYLASVSVVPFEGADCTFPF